MKRRWLRPTLSLGAAVIVAWALSLISVPAPWPWAILGIGLLIAALNVFLEGRATRTDEVKGRQTAEETIAVLRVVSELQTSGSALLADLEDIIALANEQFRIRRQRVIDWVTDGYEQLAQLNELEAERFGNPQEAEALEDYPNVTKGNIAVRPLIDLVRERLDRLEAIRSRS